MTTLKPGDEIFIYWIYYFTWVEELKKNGNSTDQILSPTRGTEDFVKDVIDKALEDTPKEPFQPMVIPPDIAAMFPPDWQTTVTAGFPPGYEKGFIPPDDRIDLDKVTPFTKKILEQHNPRLTFEVILLQTQENIPLNDEFRAMFAGYTRIPIAKAIVKTITPAIGEVYIFNRGGYQPIIADQLIRTDLTIAPYAYGKNNGRPILIADKRYSSPEELIESNFDELGTISSTGELSLVKANYPWPPTFNIRPRHTSKDTVTEITDLFDSVFPGCVYNIL